MLAKITLTIGGAEKTFQKPVTMRMTRTAYDMLEAYYAARRQGGKNATISNKEADALVDWLVEAFDCQFTAEQVLDGYSGSFLEIPTMAQEMVGSLSDALLEYPKKPTPGEA